MYQWLKHELQEEEHAALYHPIVDFFLLGGFSIIVFLLVAELLPRKHEYSSMIYGAAFYLGFVLNHPHFTSSYLLLYKDIKNKLFNREQTFMQTYRYWMAAIIAPTVLIVMFTWALLARDRVTMGLTVNILFITVAWHYAKQGFGILITMCVRKKCFFTPIEKKIILFNAHMTWIYSVVLSNSKTHHYKFYGMHYQTFAINSEYVALAQLLFKISLMLSLFILVCRYVTQAKTPAINGVLGYIAAVYIWLWLAVHGKMHPEFLYYVPAMHSLQYLAIVWFSQINANRKNKETMDWQKFNLFFAGALITGALGFYFVPNALDGWLMLDQKIFGPTVFLFMFTLFINVHHFFIDHAIWRKEDHYARSYLF